MVVQAPDTMPMIDSGKNHYVMLEKQFSEFDYTKWKHFAGVQESCYINGSMSIVGV